MTNEAVKKPIVFLMKNVKSNVRVKLKNDLEYRGRLVQCDTYMNLILDDATEYNDNVPIKEYGNVFIRGNNIILISFE
ncbi:MAG: LSM domain-containing protein [Candidatus Bathyarchaeota archaeon]